ncbi:2-dehydropantoate 2-reductase [Methylacidiphilum caldifontis]|uniref:2-dehydropantoate 2-reductase n=1 Tax=Methylacidiphilum caldifontis TaxID=2795386 RepID=UPI001A905D13|nr:2-dehydropantoate 2-reductase [Methylacidiphilum caldifontis]QSR88211.1 2-dehydropantoate 2-reductase [Methylacidiphilum caldifontis]
MAQKDQKNLHSINHKEKIAVIGAGAIGLFYGGLLAKSGYNVHFLMRKDLDLVKERGLIIEWGKETFHLYPVQAFSSTPQIGPCKWVIIALKSSANDVLLELLPPLLSPETVLVCFQNGIDNEKWLYENFGPRVVIGGILFVCINRTGPGKVTNFGFGKVELGQFNSLPGKEVNEFESMLRNAGIETEKVNSLEEARWKKLVWNIPFNGLSVAAGGIDVAEILARPELERATRELMEEIINAARAMGYAINHDFIELQLTKTRKMGNYKPSSLFDYFEKRPLEIEAIWGRPLKKAREKGINLPKLQLLYALLDSLNSRM